MTWSTASLDAQAGAYGDEVNIAGLVKGEDKWGHRVYRFVLPATKASSHGFAGRTHLVAQQLHGVWRARTLTALEIGRICGSARLTLHVDNDDQAALRGYGNAGPLRMVLPFADGLVRFFATPSTFVPKSIDDIVPLEAVQAFRGAMDLTHQDFVKGVNDG